MYTMLMAAPQSTNQAHQVMASNVAANLQTAGHPVGTQDVIPNTAETPLDKSADLHQVGAEVVGEDFSNLVEGTMSDLVGGTENYRTTKSGGFLQTLKEKLLRKGK